MTEYKNQSIDDLANQSEAIHNWAKQNFSTACKVERFDFELLLIILLAPMLGLTILGVIDVFFTGKNPCFGILGLIFFLPLILQCFALRQRTVIFLDSAGVKTRGGKEYRWSTLTYVKFQLVAVGLRASGVAATDWNKFRTELIFEDGRAMVPGKIGFEKIMENVPCEKDDRRGKMW